MINCNDILSVHQNTSTERIVTVMILPLITRLHTHLRRTENGDHLGAFPHRDATRRRLMRSQNMGELVAGHELVHRLLSVAHRSRSPLALSKPVGIEMRLLLVAGGVGPQKVGDHLLHRQVLSRLDVRQQGVWSRNVVDQRDGRRGETLQRPRDTAMHAEDDIVDRGGKRKVVENSVGLLPDLRVREERKKNHRRHFGGETLLQLAEEAAVPVVTVATLR